MNGQADPDRQIYSDCQMFSPDNILMCGISEHKSRWYLDHNLAEELPDKPGSIRLLFRPKELGYHGYPEFLSKMENQCVVCGCRQNLTKHHCVPSCFKTHFPIIYKKNFYDVLAICHDCHNAYETFANIKKASMLDIEYYKLHPACRGDAYTILAFGDVVVQEKLNFLQNRIEEFLGEPLTNERLYDFLDEKPRNMFAEYMEKVDDIEAFILDWRIHFLETMHPKYMPVGWNLNTICVPNDLEREEFYASNNYNNISTGTS